MKFCVKIDKSVRHRQLKIPYSKHAMKKMVIFLQLGQFQSGQEDVRDGTIIWQYKQRTDENVYLKC